MKKEILGLSRVGWMRMDGMGEEGVDVSGFVIDKGGNGVWGGGV